jgi:hypothetical protein
VVAVAKNNSDFVSIFVDRKCVCGIFDYRIKEIPAMFIVIVNHNGSTWPLRGNVWAFDMSRAQQFETREKAQAQLDKAKPFMKAYDEVMTPAWKVYNEAVASAKKAYNEAIAPAWKVYNEAVASAWKVYKEAVASAKKATQH